MIEFDAWATDVLQGLEWHSSQKIVPLPAAGSHMHLRLSGLGEIESWILSWGTHAKEGERGNIGVLADFNGEDCQGA